MTLGVRQLKLAADPDIHLPMSCHVTQHQAARRRCRGDREKKYIALCNLRSDAGDSSGEPVIESRPMIQRFSDPAQPRVKKSQRCIFDGSRASIEYHQMPVSVMAMVRKWWLLHWVHSRSPPNPIPTPAGAVNGTRPRRPCPETPSPTREGGSGRARSP